MYVCSGSIGFYKNFISPLLPPACRFLPTCSQYGVQAIEEFGPTKGAILTAWRLLRCSPFGGKGKFQIIIPMYLLIDRTCIQPICDDFAKATTHPNGLQLPLRTAVGR